MSKPSAIVRIVLTACVIAAAIGFLELQTGGRIGVSSDSISYLYAARTLAQGKGALTMGPDGGDLPLTHFPPLFPALLALGTKTGIDILTFAKIVNAVAYAASLLMLMLLVGRQTRSFAASLASVAVAGVTGMIALLHSYVWSEPPFLLFCLLCVYFLAYYASNSWLWILALAGVFASLAFLSRYVGLCLLPAGILFCLLASRQTLAKRAVAAGIFLIFSAAGPGAWLIRNRVAVGAVTDRTFALHLIGWRQLIDAAHVAARALPLPAELGGAGLVLAAGIVMAGCLLLYREKSSPPISFAQRCPVVSILLLVTVSYALMLLISMCLFDAAISFEDRIIAPAAVLMLGVLAICITAILREPGVVRFQKPIASILVCLAVVGGAAKSYRWFRVLDYGWVYKHGADSQTVAALRLLPSDIDVYTNAQDDVWYLTGRKTRDLPFKRNSISWLPEPGYASSFSELCRRVRSGGSVVVFFDARAFRDYMPNRKELELPLHNVEKSYSDGALFQAKHFPDVSTN